MLFLSASLLWGNSDGFAQERAFLLEKLEADHKGTLVQYLLYETDSATYIALNVAVYHYSEKSTDSTLAYTFQTKPQILSKSAGRLSIALDKKLLQYHTNAGFEEIIRRFNHYPAGTYRIYQEVVLSGNTAKADTFSQMTTLSVDSTLQINSPLRNQFRKIFSEKELKNAVAKKKATKENRVDETEAVPVSRRVSRKLGKLKGVQTNTVSYNGKLYAEMTHGSWYLGRYPLADVQTLKGNIQQEKELIKNNLSAAVHNELEDFQTVSSQMRQLYREGANNNLNGDVDLNFYTATGRDPYSGIDPTYADVHGLFSTEVKGIPVSVEGYYTTQDRNRQAKASYFRFRYDVEASKQKLQKLISDYQSKFGQTASKGAGLKSVYGQYISRLNGQSETLLQNASKEYGIDRQLLEKEKLETADLERALARKMDTAALIKKATTKAKSQGEKDSATTSVRARYAESRQKLQKDKAEIEKRGAQYRDIQAKHRKYKALLEQYQTKVHLDSVANYAQLEKLKSSNGSYKEMAKAAGGLLPEGKAKTFVSGLTHLEAGFLNRYESNYTLAGQTMKGASVGYDFGIVKAGVSAGSVEYVNREGGVDKYAAYMARLDFKEYAGQKTGLVYYGYSPARQILESTNFRGNIDAALPTFAKPVHILSVTHSGSIGQNISFEGEGAVSRRQGVETSFRPGLSNMALKLGAEYRIAIADASLTGEWEHLGKDFENKSLPVNRTGTERYTAGVKKSFFRHVLNVKLTWNYLFQKSVYAESGNMRWGIEARTKSKRFPSLLVAYKPFSTFRTVYDTLALPQRPLLGEVWLFRGNYQLKRPGGISHRFVLSYNRNSTSGGDSISYKSTTLQAAYNYSTRKWNLGANAGFMEVPASNQPLSGYVGGRSWFCNTSVSKTWNSFSAQAGNEVAFAPIGLQRFSLLAGGSYRLRNMPVSLRLSTRYTCYRLTGTGPYSSILALQFGFGWHFSVPLSDKNENI